jgi:4a-hydroxytetrahydrobiopterin dehydratase
MELHKKRCEACESENTNPFSRAEAEKYLAEVSGWILSEDEANISKKFIFDNFKSAMDFVNKVANIAEDEGHHPDICISYNKVTLALSTHSIGGLSENDFIIAVKVDKIILY